MGEDAEERTELDAQAQDRPMVDGDYAESEPCRPLLCWEDGELGYIWDWEPGSRLLGIFSDLHDYEQIGTTSFLSVGVPSELDVADGLGSYHAQSMDVATHEVIVLTRDDIDSLADAAEGLRDSATDLNGEMIAGMFEAMVLFMEADPRRSVFLFARTL